MRIELTNPVTTPGKPPVPAVPEKTWNLMWVNYFNIDGRDPNRPIIVTARVDRARETEDGSIEFMPQGHALFRCEDLLGECEADPELKAVIETLFSKIKSLTKL